MKPLTVRHAVPVIFQYYQFDAAGGLLSYRSSETEYWRLAPTAGEFLPVLGLTAPLSLLGRADEVIQ